MSTDEGKDKILNPPGRTPISEVDWRKTYFEKEIRARIDLYVESHLQSSGVLERYKDIEIEIKLFHVKIDKAILEMEREWIPSRKVVSGSHLGNLWIALGLLTSPIWFAALATGFGVAAAVVAVVTFVLSAILGWKRKTSIEIGTEYNRYRTTIRQKICKHIVENCGLIIIKLVDRLQMMSFLNVYKHSKQ